MTFVDYNKGLTEVYIKSHEAALLLNYEVKAEDISKHYIHFRIGASLFSWGENFIVNIYSVETFLTRVEVKSSMTDIQLIDWGKNSSNVANYFKTLTNLLEK